MLKKLLIVLFVMIGLVFADANCGTILNTNTILESDKTYAGTCFTIGANSITLDCNGHSITHTGLENAAHYGITANAKSNIVLKNCYIYNFTGIYLAGASKYIRIINSTITSSSLIAIRSNAGVQDLSIENVTGFSDKNYPLYVINNKRTNVTNSTFTAVWSYNTIQQTPNVTIFNCTFASTNKSHAFYQYRMNNSNISNSTFITLPNEYPSSHGAYIYQSRDSYYFGNMFISKSTNKTITSTSFAAYFYLSPNNTIDNCTFMSNHTIALEILGGNNNTIKNSVAISNLSHAIHIERANSTRIFNITAESVKSVALYITTFANDNEISNSTIWSNNSYGIYVYSGSQRNTFDNITAASNSSVAIYIARSNNNTVKSSNAVSSSSYGIYIYQSDNNTIKFSNAFSSSSYAMDIWMSNSTQVFNSSVQHTSGTYTMYIYNSKFCEISNTTISADVGYGVYIGTRSMNNSFTNITAKSRTYPAFVIATSSNHTSIQDSVISSTTNVGLYMSGAFFVSIKNTTIQTTSSNAIYLLYSRYLDASNLTVNGTAGYGIVIRGSYDAVFKNITVFTNPATRREVYLMEAGNISFYNSSLGLVPFGGRTSVACNANLSMVNSTFNRSDMRWLGYVTCSGDMNAVSVFWYGNFSVSTTNGSLASNTNINASAYVQTYGGTPFFVEVFNKTTDAEGNYNPLAEFMEFVATGYFKYNQSAQANYTLWTNHTFQTEKLDFISNRTNVTINLSITPYSIVIGPVLPRIIEIGLNKYPPYFESAVNDTVPYAIVTDTGGGSHVNFTIWNSSGEIVYFNQANVSNSSTTYYGPNITTFIQGVYQVNVTAYNPAITVNKSWIFNVVNQSPIDSCNYHTVAYKHYTIPTGTQICNDEDFVYVEDGVYITAETGAIIISGTLNMRGFVLNGVKNVTIIGQGVISTFETGLFANNSENITIRGMSFTAIEGSALDLNNTNNVNFSDGDISSAIGKTGFGAFVQGGRNINLDNFTGYGSGGFIFFANTTNSNISRFSSTAAKIAPILFSIADSNYTSIHDISISNWSTTTELATHTHIKCERCLWADFYNLDLRNGSVGINLTGSSHTRAVYIVPASPDSFPIPVSTSVLDGFANAGLLIYSLGTQPAVANNSFYNFYISNSAKGVVTESLASWTVTNTTLENFTILAPRSTAPKYCFYSANATNTTISNSSLLLTPAGILENTTIKENTLATISGNTFVYLKNTTFSTIWMNNNPDMSIYIGWGAEFQAYSTTGSTAVNKNVSNVTGGLIYSNVSATMNKTDWMILGQGITNKTCLPNMCVNESNHTFSAGALYGTTNTTNLTMNQSRFVNLTITYDTGPCGVLHGSLTLTENVTIITPICFDVYPPLPVGGVIIDCAGYSIISEYPSAIGVRIRAEGFDTKIINCNFNTTTGSYFAAINTSSTGGLFTNNTYTIQGNITQLSKSNNEYSNSSATVILSASGRAFYFALSAAAGITNISIKNSNFTAISSEGGTLLYFSPFFGLSPVINLSNSIFWATQNVSRLMFSNVPFASSSIEKTQFLQDNIQDSDGIYIGQGDYAFVLSNLTTSTNRSIHVESATMTSTNSTVNATDLVIGSGASWQNDYSANVYIFYAVNSSPCDSCLFQVQDAFENIATYNTDADGYARELPITHFYADGGLEEGSYFILNETTQTNESASLTYYNPYIFEALLGGNYTGSNTSSITYANQTVVILLQADLSKVCGNLTANTTLTQDISFAGNICYIANASNIVLDCDGYMIESTGMDSVAFYSNYANPVIKNCIINSTATSSYAAGVLFNTGATNGLIMNNTFQVIDNATRIMGARTIFANNSVIAYGVLDETGAIDVRATDVKIANSTIRFITRGFVKTLTSDRFSISNSSIFGQSYIMSLGGAGAISTNFTFTDSLFYSGDGTNSQAISTTFAKNLTFRNSNITQIRGINTVHSMSISRAYSDPIYFINTSINRSNSGAAGGGFLWSVDGKGQNVSINWLTNVKVIYDTGLPCAGCSINVTNRTNATAIYNLMTDAAGYVYLLNLTEFMANWTYTYNGVPQLNYEVFNPYNFTANKTGYYGTNTTQINSSDEVVIVLGTTFAQTNYSWVQDTNITDYVEANWSIKVYVDGSGIANVSLLMNRTGALWLLNSSGSYHNFVSNGSSYAAWTTGTNVSQNWTVVMQTGLMTCENVTGLGWSYRTFYKICTISQPNMPNMTASVLVRNETNLQELRTCYGNSYALGGDCDKVNQAAWGATLSYTPVPGFFLRNVENLTMNRYYMVLWETNTDDFGGSGGPEVVPPTVNVTNETVQPPPPEEIGEPEPITAGLLLFASNLFPFFKENFWLLIILGGAFVVVDIRDGKNDMTWLGKVGAGLIIIGAIFAFGVA